jgi:imidazolonepropionase-like amidohydrolase
MASPPYRLDGHVLSFRIGPAEIRRLAIIGHRYDDAGAASGREHDLTRLVALPGLADCHAHLAADSLAEVGKGGELPSIRKRAFAQLQRGVFLILDKGWRDEVVLTLSEEAPSSRPEVYAAGRIITGVAGYFPGFAVETDEAGLAAAVAAADTRGGWVKLIGDWPQKSRGPVINFGEEALAAAVNVAHRAGAKVAVHTMAPDTPSMAVRAGVDSIEHGLYLTAEDIATLGSRGGAWVPTIGNTVGVVASLGPGSTGARILGQGLENVRALLREAPAAGAAVLAGTDFGFPHGEVWREVSQLREFGLSAEQAVDAAGPAAYRYMGMDTLTAGASADLLLFEGNPATDLDLLGKPAAGVRAGGVVFDHAGIFQD